MLFSVLFVLGISLVPTHSKPTGRFIHTQDMFSHVCQIMFHLHIFTFFLTFLFCRCKSGKSFPSTMLWRGKENSGWCVQVLQRGVSSSNYSCIHQLIKVTSKLDGCEKKLQALKIDFSVQLWDFLSSRSLKRVRRDVVKPHDALRLMKQPRGDTRSAVRSADYMAQTLRLLQDRVHHMHKRSLNATGQTRSFHTKMAHTVLTLFFSLILV